ncbi:hypothetical protein [Streptomyces sp. NBRC 109706]|nr:hypothetical protein [Streptomyces sp. NBRC 109706]
MDLPMGAPSRTPSPRRVVAVGIIRRASGTTTLATVLVAGRALRGGGRR